MKNNLFEKISKIKDLNEPNYNSTNILTPIALGTSAGLVSGYGVNEFLNSQNRKMLNKGDVAETLTKVLKEHPIYSGAALAAGGGAAAKGFSFNPITSFLNWRDRRLERKLKKNNISKIKSEKIKNYSESIKNTSEALKDLSNIVSKGGLFTAGTVGVGSFLNREDLLKQILHEKRNLHYAHKILTDPNIDDKTKKMVIRDRELRLKRLEELNEVLKTNYVEKAIQKSKNTAKTLSNTSKYIDEFFENLKNYLKRK